jgi:hypothetical protein
MDSDSKDVVSEPPASPVVLTNVEKVLDVIESVIEKPEEIVESPEVAKLAEVAVGVTSSGSWLCSFFDWILSAKTRLHSLAKPAVPLNAESK